MKAPSRTSIAMIHPPIAGLISVLAHSAQESVAVRASGPVTALNGRLTRPAPISPDTSRSSSAIATSARAAADPVEPRQRAEREGRHGQPEGQYGDGPHPPAYVCLDGRDRIRPHFDG